MILIFFTILLLSIVALVIIYLIYTVGGNDGNVKSTSCVLDTSSNTNKNICSSFDYTKHLNPKLINSPTNKTITTAKPLKPPIPLLYIPVPKSFTPEKLNQMHKVKTIYVPLFIKKIKDINYNFENTNYSSYINSNIFSDLILTPLSKTFVNLDIWFNLAEFREENGNKNLGNLLYNYEIDKAGHESISKQQKYILDFFNNNTQSLYSSDHNSQRILARFLLSNMINETIINTEYGINIYFVPFLWGSQTVVVMDRNKPDLSLNKSEKPNKTLPAKPIIFVAEYTVESADKFVANISKDSPYLNDTLKQLGECIGMFFGMDNYEYSNLDRLSNNNIQYFRYNAFNNLSDSKLLKTIRQNDKLLKSPANKTRYQEYSNILLAARQSLLCKNDIDNRCYQNLQLIDQNIENFNQTEFLNRGPSIKEYMTEPVFTYYDTLDYSFI